QLINHSRSSGRLNLSNQSLSTIPDAVFAKYVEGPGEVDLSMDRDEGNWWEVVDLTRLTIADNAIEEIDERVVGLSALAAIDAHNNKIAKVPDLSPLLLLTILNLSFNELEQVPESLHLLPLAELHLSHNKLTHIPEGALPLATLVQLKLSHNLIDSLPANLLTAARQLTNLDLSSNCLTLTHLGDLGACRNLQILTASENALDALFPLSSLSTSAAELSLPALVKLDVRVNRLAHLGPRRVAAPALKELLLSSNRVSAAALAAAFTPPGAASASSASSSGLDGAAAAAVATGPTLVGCLASLETLDLRDNAVDALPPVLARMPALARIFVEGNPLRVPRRAVIEKGSAAILKYVRERYAAEVDGGDGGGDGGGGGGRAGGDGETAAAPAWAAE
ncbi:hypothetical protein DFJ73DRAFT_908930, partial [Zopfochytrium polystomum]